MRLVIDTDTASDDAVALMLALAEPGVTVDAITVVAGNVPLPLAVNNAIVTCDVMGRPDVAVYAGRPDGLSCTAPDQHDRFHSCFFMEHPKKKYRPSRTARKLPQWLLSSPSPQVREESEKV